MITSCGNFRSTKVRANAAPVNILTGVSGEDKILNNVCANSKPDCSVPEADIVCDRPAMTARASLCVSNLGFQTWKNSFKLAFVQLDQTDANDAVVFCVTLEMSEAESLNLTFRLLLFSDACSPSLSNSIRLAFCKPSSIFWLSPAALANLLDVSLLRVFLLGPPLAITVRLLYWDLNLVDLGFDELDCMRFFALDTPRVAFEAAGLLPMVHYIPIYE